MKIVCISDTHGEHESIQPQEADIIHVGDFYSSSFLFTPFTALLKSCLRMKTS